MTARSDHTLAARFTAEHLTMVPDKTRYYAAEQTYRDTVHALVSPGTGGEAALGAGIQRIGLGIFRPDAIAYDRVKPTLDYLRRLRIRPFHAQAVNVHGPIVRELWRFQLNAASDERMHLLDLVFDAGPSILVLFRHPDDQPVPCAVLIADAKGPAAPDRRAGWELRSVLGSPNRVEVYFHAADEPADVLREGAIVLGAAALARLLVPHLAGAGTAGTDAAGTDATDDVLDLADTLAATPTPPLHDPFLAEVAKEHGVAVSPDDRWAMLRALGERCPMFRGSARNLVRQTGSRQWWERTSLAGPDRGDASAFLRLATRPR